MDIITQNAHYRQRMIKYCEKHGATKTALRYKISRKAVYKWLKRYDGTIESLKDQSRRPKNSPKAHTAKEIWLIKKILKKIGNNDLILAFQMLVKKGYKRSYAGFKRIAKKLSDAEQKKKKPVKEPKPYTRASYPGEKIQIDVKYVPKSCVTNGNPYYQFTAIDECTRFVHRQIYDDKSTYSAKLFLDEVLEVMPFPIRLVQTDNGTEFTNTLLVKKSTHKTLFEQALLDMEIDYQRIRIATPRHNGKVERQHRTDGLRFYSKIKMYSLEHGRKQIAAYNKFSNDIIKTCLNMQSPNQVLAKFLAVMF